VEREQIKRIRSLADELMLECLFMLRHAVAADTYAEFFGSDSDLPEFLAGISMKQFREHLTNAEALMAKIRKVMEGNIENEGKGGEG